MTHGSGTSDEDGEGLTILEALQQLKDDIYKLQEINAEKKRDPLFRIEGGELELKLVAKREISAEGKVKGKWRLFVFGGDASAGVEAGMTQERLQTLKVRFSGIEGAAMAFVRGPIIFGDSRAAAGPVVEAPPNLPQGGATAPPGDSTGG